MRYIIIGILFLIGSTAHAQIQAKQVKGGASVDSLYVMLTDTVDGSGTKGLGKWFTARDFMALAGDRDWLKLTTNTIPTNTDSAYREGYTLLKGLSGGLDQKIEFLKEGILQFDQEAGMSDKRLITFKPLQTSVSNPDFYFNLESAATDGAQNNGVVSCGFNMGAGATRINPAHVANGFAIEPNFIQGTDTLLEMHYRVVGWDDVDNRVISYVTKINNKADWYGYNTVSNFWYTSPVYGGQFARYGVDGPNTCFFRLYNPSGTDGIELFMDAASDYLTINPISFGGGSELYLNGFAYTETNRLRIQNEQGTATSLIGRDGSGWVSNIATGWGLDLTGGTLLVDSSQVATQYDLTTISAGSTDLTIGGSGPSYTIESSTGTDVTVSNVFGLALSEPVANTLGLAVDSSKIATQYDISGFMSNFLLAASGTGGTETITNGETVTVSETTGLDVTRSTNTVSVALSIDEFSTDGTIEEDELLLAYDPSGTNHELIDVNNLPYVATEVDGSTTNELNTIEEGNASVQASNTNIDFQTMFDVAADGAGEVNISFDGGEAATVTTAESDDYVLLFDNGSSANQKMLWSDFSIDLIDFQEDNASEGTGNAFDFGTGIDVGVTGAEAGISLDFNEFTTDASTEGDEYVILYDPSAVTQEKVAITSLGGADGNGIYTGDGTAPTDVDVTVTDSLEFNGTLKIINDANDYVGIGAQTPAAKLHVRSTTGSDFLLEETGGTALMETRAQSGGVESPFQLKVFNKDANIDISGDYYQMGNITFSKASSTLPGGAINFNIGYDSLNLDGVLTLKSRESGATDGLVNVVGGLRYKWTSTASSSYTLNTGDFGLTFTGTGAKTATLPDAASGIVGQYFSVFNGGASGDVTISIAGGSGDTIYGDPVLNPNESAYVTCVAADKWIINN